jgi:hypothetical protein
MVGRRGQSQSTRTPPKAGPAGKRDIFPGNEGQADDLDDLQPDLGGLDFSPADNWSLVRGLWRRVCPWRRKQGPSGD